MYFYLLTLTVVFFKRNKKIFNVILINFQYTTYNLKNLTSFGYV